MGENDVREVFQQEWILVLADLHAILQPDSMTMNVLHLVTDQQLVELMEACRQARSRIALDVVRERERSGE